MSQIITRFPPSPTGYLHVGGARTAIFNWLYARNTKGKFILRIEDTDTKRSTQASVDAIFEALEWLGIDWDEGPFFQSKRMEIYQTYLQKLLESGRAYYCDCPPERLERIRKQAMEEGKNPRYDGRCRNKNLPPGPGKVVRFAAPMSGTTVLDDLIKGSMVFQNTEQMDDFVIQRSDGVPTYNFAVVVDDLTMGVNTILRGDDHVSNTPKQIQLYLALGAELPRFGHLPMVLGADRTRLSKRHGAMSVTAYRDMGYLPQALVNYLVRLGWSHGDQEFFTTDELIEKFSLKNVGKSPGVFDPEKLLSLNADHIKAAPVAALCQHAAPFFAQKGIQVQADEFFTAATDTLRPRAKTLEELADQALFYYADQVVFDEKAAKKFLKPQTAEALEKTAQALAGLEAFDEPGVENAFKQVMEQTGLKLGKIAQPVRVALTGRTFSPGIFEIVSILGKQKVIDRLERAAKMAKGE